MPELPEVETVRRGLAEVLGGDAVIARMELRRRDLRAAIPRTLPARLAGQRVLAVRRRAKYLIIDTPGVSLLSHLGMTGTWRVAPIGDERDHDHCYLHLADGRRLAFRDPRRFGLLDLIEPGGDARHPRLRGLGPEPLDARAFSADYLAALCAGRKVAIKPLIMDQRVVVGVGNIYAAEALFRAGIRPTKPARRVRREALGALVESIRSVLDAAIAAGGSTISDYRQAGGEGGWFQHDFQVYDRAGLACRRCAAPLVGKVLGGRSTVWCRACQR
ncbi:MAG TPA: bifunctional DNA-formamidopyrimidine glycosylase/DNA-(apurinic or apyrimidinic site) lyase [Planctomycetota bacterium]|nr:bifunctional DNA-formamidopyrimidine glycosylase/DNA-(apurinic or apyrimidinic site) lyase [Planctomycetota bacterium]